MQVAEKELAQIHNIDSLQLLDASKEEEKKGAIASLIFLTEKIDGMLKVYIDKATTRAAVQINESNDNEWHSGLR